MSLTMNMIGGGGGISGNRAVLVARVPSGSTVTATKGGVTLTPTMWVSETYPDQDIALFVFSSSQFDSTTPWTITATVGSTTTTATVYITTNKEYEVSLIESITLYNRGDQCTAITGGWTHDGYYGVNCLTVNSNSLYIFGTDNAHGKCGTANAINLSGYKTLQVVGNTERVINATGFQGCGILSDKASSTAMASWGTSATGNFTKYIDISDYNGNYYIALACGISGSCRGYIYELRLLRDEVT